MSGFDVREKLRAEYKDGIGSLDVTFKVGSLYLKPFSPIILFNVISSASKYNSKY